MLVFACSFALAAWRPRRLSVSDTGAIPSFSGAVCVWSIERTRRSIQAAGAAGLLAVLVCSAGARFETRGEPATRWRTVVASLGGRPSRFEGGVVAFFAMLVYLLWQVVRDATWSRASARLRQRRYLWRHGRVSWGSSWVREQPLRRFQLLWRATALFQNLFDDLGRAS